MANAKFDSNSIPTIMAVTDDANATPTRLLVDPSTGRLKVSATITSGGGITDLNGLTGGTQGFINGTNITVSSAGTNHTI